MVNEKRGMDVQWGGAEMAGVAEMGGDSGSFKSSPKASYNYLVSHFEFNDTLYIYMASKLYHLCLENFLL